MNTQTHTQTETVLLEMLLQNTGISMYDSGGDHGRAWQRNQVAGVEGITEALAVTFEYGSPVLSVYHFLTEHLEYAPMLDAAFTVWDDTHPDEGYLDTVDSFLNVFRIGQNGGFYESGRYTLNTYEFEYCLLSQVLQFTKFDLAGVDYLALQIHGGADVRGGYTKPRIFQVRDFEGFFFGSESARVSCESCKLGFYFYRGDIELITDDMENPEHAEQLDNRDVGSWFGTYETQNTCPNCSGVNTLKG